MSASSSVSEDSRLAQSNESVSVGSTGSTKLREIMSPLLQRIESGKDLVENWLMRALKLFRRCKMIESEIELQFKLIDYLSELYHSCSASSLKVKTEYCLRVVEQLRVVHDQVIPLFDDELCEAVLLNELAAAARRLGPLKRKETLYKY